ncbi:ABC transporter permease [Nocardioides panacihumi]|uniref:Transport permease protein n=1 Tax=Nocardioides panacihumi TaxID=400774 RepID=A0ABN2RIS0_9ACTN
MTTTTTTSTTTTTTTTAAWTEGIRDSVTMLRRNLKHLIRYPSLTLMIIGMPVVFLLLFVFVFGGTMGAGLPGGAGSLDHRSDYLHYVTPAILVMTVASVANSTAIVVAKDATEGIIDRFRTMPIARSAPLTGHVLAAMLQTVFAVLVVLAVAMVLGYRGGGSLAGWAGAAGMILLLGVAVTWLSVALGLASGSVEAASNAPLPLILLPFLSSGFVPTDSMPTVLAWIAEHQPFTPIIETLRACLEGRDPGSDAWWAIGWCVLIALVCFRWACRVFGRVRAV